VRKDYLGEIEALGRLGFFLHHASFAFGTSDEEKDLYMNIANAGPKQKPQGEK
jgi:hypothetical protein